jgi:transcriptional regulator with XRE-family HTH domain
VFTRITNSKLFKRLKDKKYRNQFIAGEVRRTIPFQLRALRAERKWTQADLGKEAEMPQTVVSRIENGDAASLSIKTLLKLATAFDVALVVRFEPIDRLITWVDGLSPEVMSPRRSSEILAEIEQNATRTLIATATVTQGAALRVVSGTPSGITQNSFAFDRPRLVASRATGEAFPHIKTEETDIWQKIVSQ